MQAIRTLQARIFFVVAGLVAAIGGGAFALQAYASRQYELAMTEALNASVASTISAELAASGNASESLADRAKPIFTRLMNVNPTIEIYLLGRSGAILGFTAPAQEVRRSVVDLAPITAFIANDFDYPIFGDNPKDPASKKIFSAAPLNVGRDTVGYVYVILGGVALDAAARRTQTGLLARSGAILATGALLAGLAATLYIRADVIARLHRLVAAIGEFRASGFRKSRAAVGAANEKGDEIDAVSRAFGAMEAQIEMLLAKLEENDRGRRELLANVAHDLRTPIASARAHLETLVIKQAVLSSEQRADHLEIAARQLERLGRLAEELFDLGKLEAPSARAATERFPLAELAQDVVQKFQIEARERGVVLSAGLGADMPHLNGDIALIERVLDNLIENAIQHTPPEGRIDLTIAARGPSVVITVADTGGGIAEQHLPHVFERFYRAEPREGHDSGGSGLGLAIVRRIVEMHGGVVSVESTLGGGARFSVTLPAG